jgi:hypothetical protein
MNIDFQQQFCESIFQSSKRIFDHNLSFGMVGCLLYNVSKNVCIKLHFIYGES